MSENEPLVLFHARYQKAREEAEWIKYDKDAALAEKVVGELRKLPDSVATREAVMLLRRYAELIKDRGPKW